MDGRYFYPVCALTAPGLDWMLENQSRFKLRADNPPEVADEDSVLAPIVAGKERSAGCARRRWRRNKRGRRVTRGAEITSKFLFAGVAELADAPDSKSGYRKAVKVRFLSPAPGFFASRNDKEGLPIRPESRLKSSASVKRKKVRSASHWR
jgi:hypothetical protein